MTHVVRLSVQVIFLMSLDGDILGICVHLLFGCSLALYMPWRMHGNWHVNPKS